MDNQQGNLLDFMSKYFEVMAYSIGAMMGDGTVKKYTVCKDGKLITSHNVAIRMMDLDCVSRVCFEVDSLFHKNYSPQSYDNPNGTKMYSGTFSNSFIYDFFNYFIREKLVIPDEAFRASRRAKLDFIAGLFDTDGYVSMSKQPNCRVGYSWRIGFASRFRTFVEDLVRLMSKLGVKIGKIYTQVSQYNTTMYIIKPNIRSFIDTGCYFHIARKANKLALYLDAVRPQSYSIEPSETIMSNP